jgi:hypothetical protein
MYRLGVGGVDHTLSQVARVAALTALVVTGWLLLLPAQRTPDTAHAAAATLAFDPGAGIVAAGQSLDVTINQNVDVPSSGVKVDIVYGCGLLELVDVKAGSAYGGIPLVGVQPETKAEAIASANRIGLLRNLSVVKAPGTTVAPGSAPALVVTFRAREGFSGTSPLQFLRPEVLDGSGLEVPVTLIDGTLMVTGSGPTLTPTPTGTSTPTPSATPTLTNTPSSDTYTPTSTPEAVCTGEQGPTSTPTVTPSVTITPGPTNTPLPEGCNPTTTPTFTFTPTPPAFTNTPEPPTFTPTPTPTPAQFATLVVNPGTLSVQPGSEFVLDLVQNAPSATIGLQTNVQFDRTLLELTAVEVGEPYASSGGQLILVPDATTALNYANNCTGLVENIGVVLVPPASVASGEQAAFVLKFKARSGVNGTSQVQLLRPAISPTNDGTGTGMGVNATAGQVTVDANAPTGTPTSTATLEPAAATGTAAAQQTAQAISTVAGTTSSPGSATGLPSAGGWLGEDARRSLILGISAVTLLTSLIALANTWVRRRM